jgi:secretion/DNA translocation related TadE-like protein
MNDDRGSGSILALSILAAVLAIAALVLPLSVVLSAKQQAAAAADAAALAAADVAVGALPGIPCEAATAVVAANGAVLDGCRVDGAIVTVGVSVSAIGLAVRARATAGPPASGVN